MFVFCGQNLGVQSLQDLPMAKSWGDVLSPDSRTPRGSLPMHVVLMQNVGHLLGDYSHFLFGATAPSRRRPVAATSRIESTRYAGVIESAGLPRRQQAFSGITQFLSTCDNGDLRTPATARRRVRRSAGARIHRLHARRGRLLFDSRRRRSPTGLRLHSNNTRQRGRVRIRNPTGSADGQEYRVRR